MRSKEPQTKQVETKKVANVVEIIEFHTTHRCVTCVDIENNTKFTLDNFFKNEVDNQTITFRTINVDENENYAIAEKFQAMGTALFLNVVVDGKEQQINLTDFAFLKASDKDAFVKEMKVKLEAALKTI